MNFEKSVYTERISQVQDYMTACELDVLFVWGEPKGSFGLLSAKNDIGYLTNWPIRHPDMGPSLLLLTTDKPPVQWVSGPDYTLSRINTLSSVKSIRLANPMVFVTEAAEYCYKHDIPTNRIGIVRLGDIPLNVYRDVERSFMSADIIDATTIFDRLKLYKSTDEIKLIKQAAETVDEMYTEFERVATSGITESRIAHAMEHSARKNGAEFASTWITSGSSGGLAPAFEHHRMNRVVGYGDLVVAGVHIVQQNYWGHAIKMGVIGTPSPKQEEYFDIVHTAQEVIIDGAKEKNSVTQTRDEVMQIYNRSSYMNSFRSFHGLGMSYGGQPEEPQPNQLDAKIVTDRHFEKGMVFEAHPNIWGGGTREVFCATGDMIVVTETGVDVLTNKQSSLYQLGQ